MKLAMNILIASSVCAALLPTSSFAANPNGTTSFNISTELQQGIVLTKKRDLTFPEQSTGTTANYVVAPSDPTSADFSAAGTPNTDAELSFTSATTTLTCVSGACLTGGTNTLTVDTFTCDASACAYTFNGTGDIPDMLLGATEHVANTNLSGTYTGTQNISLNYK